MSCNAVLHLMRVYRSDPDLKPSLSLSSYHSAPLKLHLGNSDKSMSVAGILSGATPSFTLHQGPMYDSVFVLSSGRITSIGPQGEFNWQVRGLLDMMLLLQYYDN